MAKKQATIQVETYYRDDLIVQEVYSDIYGKRKEICRNILNLQDEGVRKALSELGWLAPGEYEE